MWDSCGVERVDSITRTYIEQIKIQHFVVFADVTKDYELKNVKRFLRLIGKQEATQKTAAPTKTTQGYS